MLWVAITGGIACGKSAFASILRQKGYAVLNTDQLARDVTVPGSPLLNQLALHFGSWILNSKGELDRPQLFDKLFKSPDFKKELEDLLHPPIQENVKRWKKKRAQEGCLVAFCEVPLLYEKGLEKHFDFIVVLSSPPSLQQARLKAKLKQQEHPPPQGNPQQEGQKEEQLQRILGAGTPLKIQKQRADYAIENEGTLKDLEEKTNLFLNFLKTKTKKTSGDIRENQ